MFLSGIFFPIATMRDVLQTVARLLPLTYLADALRQVMVDGTPFAPLWVCVAVLVAWLVGCFAIAGRGTSRGSSARTRGRAAYQRSSWTMSARARRPPGLFGRLRSAGSAG